MCLCVTCVRVFKKISQAHFGWTLGHRTFARNIEIIHWTAIRKVGKGFTMRPKFDPTFTLIHPHLMWPKTWKKKSARRFVAKPWSQSFRSWLGWKVNFFSSIGCENCCGIPWLWPIYLVPKCHSNEKSRFLLCFVNMYENPLWYPNYFNAHSIGKLIQTFQRHQN